jgi:hypothetical protein
MMGITITDHIIVSNNDYLSLRTIKPDLFCWYLVFFVLL